MLELILSWDQSLFFVMNGWDNAFLDAFVPLYRHKLFWAPLYLFVISFILFNFPKNAHWILMFTIGTIMVSDTMSSKVIKESVQRVRPCNDIAISSDVNNRIRCGGGYSFTSSHATNHAALAFFLIFLFKDVLRKPWKWVLAIWALSVGIAQIYVGVHYPIDVLAGLLLGGLIGGSLGRLYHSVFSLE